jgi:uncharacterized membrane protein YidH (DUF202 family)
MKFVIAYLLYMIGTNQQPDISTMIGIYVVYILLSTIASGLIKYLLERKGSEMNKAFDIKYIINVKDIL